LVFLLFLLLGIFSSFSTFLLVFVLATISIPSSRSQLVLFFESLNNFLELLFGRCQVHSC
jgi:hypothetical protein